MVARSTTLQSKAGYIDARPYIRQIGEISCDARPDHTFGSKPAYPLSSRMSAFARCGHLVHCSSRRRAWPPIDLKTALRTRELDIAAGAKRAAADTAARAEAEAVIQRWNDQLAVGRDMLWSPTIGAALLAGTPWLDGFCPGCGTSRAIDLRRRSAPARIGRHAGARPAVLVVRGIGTDAETAGAVRSAASKAPNLDSVGRTAASMQTGPLMV
jgi:hypothetical protein